MKEGTYYSKNKEKILEKVKEYREQNKEYYTDYYKKWYAENKDAVNAKRCEKRKILAANRPKKEKPVKEKKEPVFFLPVIEPEVEPQTVIVLNPEDFTVKFE